MNGRGKVEEGVVVFIFILSSYKTTRQQSIKRKEKNTRWQNLLCLECDWLDFEKSCLTAEHRWSLKDCPACSPVTWANESDSVGFLKKILVYMENEGQNRRWYVFESVKISFSKCWFREFKVKKFILDNDFWSSFSTAAKGICLVPAVLFWTIWQLHSNLRWHFPLCYFSALNLLAWDIWLLAPLVSWCVVLCLGS